MSDGVVNFAASSVRMSARISASPRVSSPMPGALSRCTLPLHLDVGAFGEHGVEVRVDDQHGPPGGAGATADAHHVALGVHLDVAQPLLAQHLHEHLRARLLLERRRRNLRQRNQLAHEAVVVGLDERHGLLELRPVDDGPDGGVGRLGRGGRHEEREKMPRKQLSSACRPS